MQALSKSGNRPNSKVNGKPPNTNFGNAAKPGKMVVDQQEEMETNSYQNVEELQVDKYMMQQEILKLTQ